MRNRINMLPHDADMGYDERIRILRERKIEDTKDKTGNRFFRDGDDYGAINPPDDFQWEPIIESGEDSWYGYKGWSENFYHLMEIYPVHIDPCDAFANRWTNCMSWLKEGHRWNPKYPFDHLMKDIEKYGIVPGIGADAHFGKDYRIGLELGWGGLLEKLNYYREQNPGHDEFYDAEVMAIKGVQLWMEHTLETIESAIGNEQNPYLRENLIQMYACNEHLVNGVPRTLREACQWICWFNMASRTYNRDGAGGQLDELLRPYYERDKNLGIITEEEAKFYIACLLLNDPHYYQVGGLSVDGKDITSYFSYLILEAADWINTSCNITVRVHKGMDTDFLHTAVRYLFKNKNGWPRFSGEESLCSGFMRKGYPLELARQRIAVGCHWMSLPGMEYTLNDCVKINCAKVFRLSLDEMMEQGGAKSTSALWERFKNNMATAVEKTAQCVLFHLRHQVFNEPELMLNLLSHGPVEKGLDAVDGGAMYYNMCIDGTGIATVSDSFAALEQRIEMEKRISWPDIYTALQNNFDGKDGEYIRRMLISSERYGGGDTLADRWSIKISRQFSDDVNSMDDGKIKFIPGWFSWSNTIKLGKEVHATPDGRKDFEPINHGANPNPGFRKDGALTAMSNSICAIQPGFGNTAPIQLEMDPGLITDDEGVDKICSYIRTIFDMGATLLNINIINAAQIMEAHKNPDLYPDLVVRVTGFTAYFCMLTPEFRKLVVDRILIAS